MKTKITLALSVLLMIVCSLRGQSQHLLKQFDSLQNGQILLTVRLQDSTFFKNYLIANPMDTGNFFKNICSVLPQSDNSNNEYDATDIDLFGENISALPWDIAFNPTLNKFYIYNFRKVMVYNNSGTGFFETPIIISELEELSSDMIEINPGKKILHYNNIIYCTSNEGKLIAIDCNTHQITTIFSCSEWSSVYKSDLRCIGSSVYWYYSVIGESNKSYLRRVNGLNITASLDMPGETIFDWCFGNANTLFLSTDAGLYKYDSEFSCLASNLNFDNIVNIEYFDDGTTQRLIAKVDNEDYSLMVFSNSLIQTSIFNVSSNKILNMI